MQAHKNRHRIGTAELIVSSAMIFIYAVQYPLSILFSVNFPILPNSLDWISGASFVLFGYALLISGMLAGGAVAQEMPSIRPALSPPKLNFWLCYIFLLIVIFSNLLLLNFRAGMTIYSGFAEQPFRIVGILFYFRLLIAPMALGALCEYCRRHWPKRRFELLVVILICGFASSGASGSRFVAIAYALPIMLLFSGSARWLVSAVVALGLMLTASLSRAFALPHLIDAQHVAIFAAEELITDTALSMMKYIVARTMGANEVFLALRFHTIEIASSTSIYDAARYFLPFLPGPPPLSMKTIYGLPDSTFGAVGLDLFSNYLVYMRYDLFSFSVVIFFSGFLLRFCVDSWNKIASTLGFSHLSSVFLVVLFLFTFDGRAHLLLPIACTAALLIWIMSLLPTLATAPLSIGKRG